MIELIVFQYLISILQIGRLEGGQMEAVEALGVGAGIFALLLFTLSVYAWFRRRQPALLIVSSAFLLFFVRHAVALLGDMYEFNPTLNLVLAFMDFIILALFFVAIVVRPKRKPRGEEF